MSAAATALILKNKLKTSLTIFSWPLHCSYSWHWIGCHGDGFLFIRYLRKKFHFIIEQRHIKRTLVIFCIFYTSCISLWMRGWYFTGRLYSPPRPRPSKTINQFENTCGKQESQLYVACHRKFLSNMSNPAFKISAEYHSKTLHRVPHILENLDVFLGLGTRNKLTSIILNNNVDPVV